MRTGKKSKTAVMQTFQKKLDAVYIFVYRRFLMRLVPAIKVPMDAPIFAMITTSIIFKNLLRKKPLKLNISFSTV
jgi:hypothetical protein